MDISEHRKKLETAVISLIKNDIVLLEKDVNERTISARLAHYLVTEYPSLNVDCEYNRKGDEPKRLPSEGQTSTNDTSGKTIFPDVIVHSRGDDSQNEVVIEIKKEGNNDTERDFHKLKSLTSDSGGYKYRCGFHVTFQKNSAVVDTYENGQRNSETFTIS
ncbi:MAG: hypothetical protein K8F90_20160 [Hyphomicrobiales bacterium]|nr:hypothetical protein [Hyphomicrobiales bacterium]